MQFVKYAADGSIEASANFRFPGSVPAREEVVRNEEGQLVYKSDINELHEAAIRGARAAEQAAAEAAIEIEAQRVPDLEDATIDLAAYIAELEERIVALESEKEAVNG